MSSAAAYGRAFGAIVAFLIVALFVKFADLLLTYELVFDPPTWRNRIAQISTALRFSWQEFAIATVLFAVINLWHHAVPEPGRRTRIALGVLRAALVIGAIVLCGMPRLFARMPPARLFESV